MDDPMTPSRGSDVATSAADGASRANPPRSRIGASTDITKRVLPGSISHVTFARRLSKSSWLIDRPSVAAAPPENQLGTASLSNPNRLRVLLASFTLRESKLLSPEC